MLEAQNSIPDNISIAEDKVCLLKFILKCDSAYILREAYYHWKIRGDSMSHKPNEDYLQKINYVYRYINDLYKEKSFTREMRKQAEIYIVELLFLGINKRLGFENDNMVWIDPYWIEKIPPSSRIVLYGGGELAEKYYKQIINGKKLKFLACVDYNFKRFTKWKLKVEPIDFLEKLEYDYILITIKNENEAIRIKNRLINTNISIDKILWFEQPEAYWKYIEAEGLLKDYL